MTVRADDLAGAESAVQCWFGLMALAMGREVLAGMRKRARKGTGRSAAVPQNGAAIRAFRERMKLTKTEFCRKYGFVHCTLANIESERRPAGEKTLRRLAESLNVPLEAISRTRDNNPDLNSSSATVIDGGGQQPSHRRFEDAASAFEAVLQEVGLAAWLVKSLSHAARARLAGQRPGSLRSVGQEVIEGVTLPEVNRNALERCRHRPHPGDWVIFGPWLTIPAACQILGITDKTLSCYVRRSVVRSMGPPLLRNRIVNAHDIAALAHMLRSPLDTDPSTPRRVGGRDQ